MTSQSVYERCGGFARVNRLVMAFYDTVLDSDEIGPYFDGIDMKRQIDHQTKFIAALLGGPVSYDDNHLLRTHAQLGVTDADFDTMKRLFAETMNEQGFAPPDVDFVLQEIESRRPVIVVAPHVD